MIRLSQVSKKYRSGASVFEALRGVDVRIEQGEFVSILGPSGSGKSTLMHLIGGLDRPTSGKVEVDGRDLGALSAGDLAAFRGHDVGFVFQFFNLLPQASALDNVMLPMIYGDSGRHERRARAEKLLIAMGLSGKSHRRPSELSGGEQQRVAIARALASDPKIILADEPTGNLDTKTGEAIVEILNLFNKAGKTLIIVTHDERVAARAGRIIRIQDGKIV